MFFAARLVHGEDINAAAAFVVDPDTQHLYVPYGRGSLPQIERRKLMTGKDKHLEKSCERDCVVACLQICFYGTGCSILTMPEKGMPTSTV